MWMGSSGPMVTQPIGSVHSGAGGAAPPQAASTMLAMISSENTTNERFISSSSSWKVPYRTRGVVHSKFGQLPGEFGRGLSFLVARQWVLGSTIGVGGPHPIARGHTPRKAQIRDSILPPSQCQPPEFTPKPEAVGLLRVAEPLRGGRGVWSPRSEHPGRTPIRDCGANPDKSIGAGGPAKIRRGRQAALSLGECDETVIPPCHPSKGRGRVSGQPRWSNTLLCLITLHLDGRLQPS